METRKEYKFLLSNNELLKLSKIFQSKLSSIHPEREISSLYMDTIDLKLFKDSQLFDVDKIKFRYRKYSNDNNIYFEIKENNKLGKFKKTENTNYKNFKEIKNLFFKDLLLEPTIEINYIRNYYKYKNLRITIDKGLNYKLPSNRSRSKIKKNYQKNIIEYKLNTSNDPDIEKYFVSNPTKFSKYEEGINLLYNF